MAKRIHQLTIAGFEKLFPNEEACCLYLIEHRWAGAPRCPRCDHDTVHPVSTMAFRWQCYKCSPSGYRFSHLTGTMFENTNKPLRDWFRVIHMMLTSKKGLSAMQVYRVMGFGSYETALYMTHRVRAGLVDQNSRKLLGIVEVDETFVGGRGKNRHIDKRGDDSNGRGPSGKAIVVGAVSRKKGTVVARVVANTKGETLIRFVREAVSHRASLICPDAFSGYGRLGDEFPHGVVDHAQGEYVVGAVHTNTIEGFWSIFRRGMMGTFHKVSTKYLPLYVAEFGFRYNNRENADIFGAAISAC